MRNLSRIPRLFEQITLLTLKTLIVTLILGYGGLIAFSGMMGYDVGNYQIATVYTFDRIDIACGQTRFRVSNGSLTTARRMDREDYAIVVGDIEATWPEPIQRWSQAPPSAFHQMRLSLNAKDMAQLLDVNKAHMRPLLRDESDEIRLRRQARQLFDRGAARLRPLLLPHLDSYRPPARGVMDLAILDEKWGGLWTLTTGPMARGPSPPSVVVTYGHWIAFSLITVSSLLLAMTVSAAALGTLAQAILWIWSVVREPGQFMEAPGTNAFITLTILLVAGALVFVLKVM